MAAPKVEARVTVDTRGFRKFDGVVDRAVEGATRESLRRGAMVARADAPKGETLELSRGLHATMVKRTRRGYEGSIEGESDHTLFQARGTHGRRKHRKSRGGNVSAGASGIKPHRFLARGLLEARRTWAGNVRSRLRL